MGGYGLLRSENLESFLLAVKIVPGFFANFGTFANLEHIKHNFGGLICSLPEAVGI